MVSEEQNSDVELASEVVPVPQVRPKVQAPEVIDVTQEENNIPLGKPRQRKKALYAAILKQMEFYFSDSNLSKDRFLAGLIKENPDVDLEIFLRFNRIRSLTTDIKSIAKAIGKSTMLQLSEDGTKVHRITPVLQKENVDECTVYVQRLPSDTDHEWLSSLFSEYGPVAYVSIPKFNFNHKIKGFAFVEFEKPEDAQKCLKAFRAKGCLLPSQTSPTDVLSITTFAEEKQAQNGHANCSKSGHDILKNKVKEESVQKVEQSSDSEQTKSKKNRKRNKSDDLGDSGTDQSDSSKTKKKKDSDNLEKNSSIHTSDPNAEKEEKRAKKRKNRHSLEAGQDSDAEFQTNPNENKKAKRIKINSEIEDESDNQIKNEIDNAEQNKDTVEYSSEDTTKEKKKKNKKKRNRRSSELGQDSDAELQTNLNENKKAKRIKIESETGDEPENSIKNEIDNAGKNEDTVKCSNEEDATEKKKKKKRKKKNHSTYEVLETADMGLQVMGKKDWKKLRNKYLELQRAKMKQLKQHIRKARWNQWGDRNKMETEQEETVNNKKEVAKPNKENPNPASNLTFTPGVIVKIELTEACVDPKSFKAELRSNSSIKYIDIKEGSNEAFIRCDSSEAANTLAQTTSEERRFKVLTGDEEKSYWDKIVADREQKIGNKIKVKQRGRDKLLKKAEKELGKHIKFDEV